MVRRIASLGVAIIMAATVMVVANPTAASAEPGAPVFCSAWKNSITLRHRACVELGGTYIGFLHEVQNLGTANRSVKVVSRNYINSGWDPCFSGTVSIAPGTTFQRYCSTTRRSGVSYHAYGELTNADVHTSVTSPTKTG
jgi:hypothetical protein